MARLRSAPNAPPSTTNATAKPTTSEKRTALREKTNTSRATRAKANEKGAVKDVGDFVNEAPKTRKGRTQRGVQQSDELVMAGGLGQRGSTAPVEEDEEIRVATSDAPMTTDELAKDDGPPPPSARQARRPPRMTRKAVHNEAQSKVLDGLKKRMEATARQKKAAPEAAPPTSESIAPTSDSLPTNPATKKRKSNVTVPERSEFSISPSPPPPGKLQSANKRASVAAPGSALRVHGTPGGDHTILALKNFKRRPRQGSMLAMVQQRTASARPSLANAQPQEDSTVFDLDDDSEIEDEFSPEAEGTPAQLSKTRQPKSAKRPRSTRKTATPGTTKSSTKRKSDAVGDSVSALSSLRSKRRKSDVAPPAEEPLPNFDVDDPQVEASSDRQPSPVAQAITSDIQVLNSSPASTPPTETASSDKERTSHDTDFAVPSTEEQQQQQQQQAYEEANAELDLELGDSPGSSPLASPEPSSQQTDTYADPATQLSPPPPETTKPQRGKQKQKPVVLSTATLQSLLPKRRQRKQTRLRRTEYDISSDEDEDAELDASHLDGNEDELGGRLRRQAKTAPAKGRKSAASRKQKPKPAPNASTTARKASKPGARKKTPATTSDKENEGFESLDEDEDTGDVTELPQPETRKAAGASSDELEKARKKFAEVDDWDMSFESMSFEDHRSSSQGWR